MSFLKPIRQRIENLLKGTYGNAPYVMQVGRFTQVSDDSSAEVQYNSSSERSFEVEINPPSQHFPLNLLDGEGTFESSGAVKVSYQLTKMGEEDSEGLTALNGAGTLKAIRDRATTDAQDILCVLDWYENCAGLDPHVISIDVTGAPSLQINSQSVILSIPLRILMQADAMGNYTA